MALQYRRADVADIKALTELRIRVLKAANGLGDDADLSQVAQASHVYYAQSLPAEEHIAYVAWDGETVAGTGGVSFFRVLPTVSNPSGRKAYIMNMYTAPEYRRQGIARDILGRLVRASRQKGVTFIALEATAQGRLLYEKCGFVAMEDEMRLGANENKI